MKQKNYNTDPFPTIWGVYGSVGIKMWIVGRKNQ